MALRIVPFAHQDFANSASYYLKSLGVGSQPRKYLMGSQSILEMLQVIHLRLDGADGVIFSQLLVKSSVLNTQRKRTLKMISEIAWI